MQLQVIQNQNQLTLQKKANIIEAFCSKFSSENTKKAYSYELELFFAFCESKSLNITEVLPFHIDSYLLEYRFQSSATINRKISALKSFYKWMKVNEFVMRNPLDSLSINKTSTKNPTLAFSDEEAKNVLNLPKINTIRGNAHRLIFHLLFYTGIRREELINLKVEDLHKDREHHVLRVLGKGNKYRFVPVSEPVINEVQRYLQQYTALTGNVLESSDYIVQLNSSVGKKPINPSTVLRIVKRYAKMLGVQRRVSPHSCRATAISHLLEKSESIRNVADFAGHTSTTTTQLYDKKRDGYANSAAYNLQY